MCCRKQNPKCFWAWCWGSIRVRCEINMFVSKDIL